MAIAEIPKDEDKRLRSLRELGILDTPAEQVFDAVTEIASSICGTPIAAISFIDADR